MGKGSCDSGSTGSGSQTVPVRRRFLRKILREILRKILKEILRDHHHWIRIDVSSRFLPKFHLNVVLGSKFARSESGIMFSSDPF